MYYTPKCKPIWGGKRYGRFLAKQRIAAYKTSWARKHPDKIRLIVRRKTRVTAASIGNVSRSKGLNMKLALLRIGAGSRRAAMDNGIRFAHGQPFHRADDLAWKRGRIKQRRERRQERECSYGEDYDIPF